MSSTIHAGSGPATGAIETVLALLEDPVSGEQGARLVRQNRAIALGSREIPITDGVIDFLGASVSTPNDRMSGTLYDLLVWRFGLRWKLWVRWEDIFAFRDRVLADWRGSGPFLDCPTGTAFPMIPRLGADSPFTAEAPWVGVDHSMRWLQRARRRLEAAGAHHAVLIRADARRLPFRDGAFTGLLSISGLHCFDDMPRVAREFHRVLRQGAHFGITAVAAGVERSLDRFIERMHRRGVFAPPMTRDVMEDALVEAGLKPDARFIGKLAGFEGRA